ncbi:MAG: hypothetical protein LKG90_09435 [Lachnospiraceae bacterium]|nr:hypothetical protein [Lachnospiraceae bacterium]MCH4029800.1 hypothetical protein [Lachnospiraceae bacterium]MCH4113372.1 hypothetical protein [Lachnospiraceae bacterium]MCI1353971.1 hypothetical protein [Lachnospiraceae bacterium]MCI1368058.1 hypothetical protein [Lachnospiraceae bacterium]
MAKNGRDRPPEKQKKQTHIGNAYILLINAVPAAVYYLAIQLYLSSAFHSGEVFDGRGLCGDNMP